MKKTSFFKETILSIYGKHGKIWLADLPRLQQEIAVAWGLESLQAASNLSYNYIASGFQNGEPIILKLSLDREALIQESTALKAFSGFGAVKVLRQTEGILLLEKARPGTSLKEYFPTRDSASIQIVCRVIQKLHQAPLPLAGTFPKIDDWLAVLENDWQIPIYFLEKARRFKDYLLKTAPASILLHGDLHHENILKTDDGWAVIDPKGVMGEPIYEIAAFIRNPLPEILKIPHLHTLMANRRDITEFCV